MTPPAIRALVADDSLISRAGLRALLEEVPGVEVAGEAADLPGALAAVGEVAADLVITDLRMPPGQHDEGVQLARSLARTHPGVSVLLLSQHCEPDLAARLFAAGARGRGYLLKDRVSETAVLERAIADVTVGGTAIDRAVVAGMVVDRRAVGSPGIAALTPREAQVLELVAAGRSNASIARALGIARRAVETNINRIFAKLGLADDGDIAPRVAATLTWLEARGN